MILLWVSKAPLQMIIYVRHSDDEGGNCSRAHDCKLTRNGLRLASRVGTELIEKYGIPNIIFVSPFRRTIQTTQSMLKTVDSSIIDIRQDIRIGRYFSSREQRHPDIAPQTDVTGLPIEESYTAFKRRVRRFARSIQEYEDANVVVWVVTHALVYKRIGEYYDKNLPGHIPFMHNFRVGHRIRHRRHTHRDHRTRREHNHHVLR